MRTVELRVAGMTCGSCEESVERALSRIRGVRDVRSDHRRGSVEFQADDSVGEAAVRQVIEDGGYDLESMTGG